jgi:sensor domain CHASE-containing protein
VRRDGFSLYFPLMTCLVISVVVSIVIWIFRR